MNFIDQMKSRIWFLRETLKTDWFAWLLPPMTVFMVILLGLELANLWHDWFEVEAFDGNMRGRKCRICGKVQVFDGVKFR